MADPGFYAVHVGRVPGIFASWDQCLEQVYRYPGAKYKKYSTLAEAENALANGPGDYYAARSKGSLCLSPSSIITSASAKQESIIHPGATPLALPNEPALCVHVSLNQETGRFWYSYNWTGASERKELVPFTKDNCYQGITKELAEFDALVYGIKYLMKKGLPYPLYTENKPAKNFAEACYFLQVAEPDMTGANGQALKADPDLYDHIADQIDWLGYQRPLNHVEFWNEETMGKSPAGIYCEQRVIDKPTMEQILHKILGLGG
jgi:hypothetical protein